MIANAGFFAIGVAAGMLHFILLRWNAALYLQASRIWGALAVQVLRLGVLAALLVMVVLHGALPLLLATLGLLIARPFVVRWMAPL